MIDHGVFCEAGNEQNLKIRSKLACRIRQLAAIHTARQAYVGHEQVDTHTGLQNFQTGFRVDGFEG